MQQCLRRSSRIPAVHVDAHRLLALASLRKYSGYACQPLWTKCGSTPARSAHSRIANNHAHSSHSTSTRRERLRPAALPERGGPFWIWGPPKTGSVHSQPSAPNGHERVGGYAMKSMPRSPRDLPPTAPKRGFTAPPASRSPCAPRSSATLPLQPPVRVSVPVFVLWPLSTSWVAVDVPVAPALQL